MKGPIADKLISPLSCWLEYSPAPSHTHLMEHINKCTDTLRPLIQAGEEDSIPHAEKAIDDMLAAAPAHEHKDSLKNVRSAIDAYCASIFAPHQLKFADAINNYIERLMTRFE